VRKGIEFLIALGLASFFAVNLVFVSLVIPINMIHPYLLKVSHDYWWPPAEAVEGLRPLGYSLFLGLLALIFAGFVARRERLSVLGSIALYLPTFGYFAFAMFFLAGVGVLRILWLPLIDISPHVLRLGDIVYLPYTALTLVLIPMFLMAGISATEFYIPLSMIIIWLGLLFFVLGASTWLYGRFKGCKIIDFWIYKGSRHPQYLGFLLWSYGILSLATFIGVRRGGYLPEPSLPWLISALIIAGVALHEEIIMTKKHGEKYLRYRDGTWFMVPLPKQVSTLITAPARFLLKKNWPENAKEVVYVVILYGAILVLLSLPLALLFPIR